MAQYRSHRHTCIHLSPFHKFWVLILFQAVVPIVNSLNTQKLEFIHPKVMLQALIVILTTD